jgi:hypothetical protein
MLCINASFIMGALALVMAIGMSTFYTPFLQGFLWLWLGIGAGAALRLNSASVARSATEATAPYLRLRQASA